MSHEDELEGELEMLIVEGDIEHFSEKILAQPSLVRWVTPLGNQLLHYACKHKQPTIAALLIDEGQMSTPSEITDLRRFIVQYGAATTHLICSWRRFSDQERIARFATATAEQWMNLPELK